MQPCRRRRAGCVAMFVVLAPAFPHHRPQPAQFAAGSQRHCTHAGYVRYGDVPSMTPAELAAWAAARSSAPPCAAPTSPGIQSGAGHHAAAAAADVARRRARRAGTASAAAASGCTSRARLLAGSGQGVGAGCGVRGAARPACSDSEATISGTPCRRGGRAGGSSAAQAAVDQASAPVRRHSKP